MGTFTAQLLVGSAHPYEGGIYGITHTLQLSENGRPAWILNSTNDAKKAKIMWIPTLEHMLEDALLMIGLYVWKDEALCKMKERYFTNQQKNYIQLYDDIDPKYLEEMRARCRDISSTSKIMISVFEGSTIETQLPVIRAYDYDFEVCLSVFQKAYNVWSGEREERGLLKPS
ncbi:hypothetical protein H1D32_03990 [Anaerobacillus sp. CMMVII]|uniref:hypothetical protein n=1 Tax=Anaerobacillus sp. CMMVII TaxID=2755588 RepID=UPI0021B6FE7C|nr:hypothetical protein [Anaerobacillus sp. CMMVII]MCT8136970.1 hypothetical protein [Anaerobacillus sp. CMMVII]